MLSCDSKDYLRVFKSKDFQVVNEGFNIPSMLDDWRKKVNFISISYYKADGFEYRKRIEFPISANFSFMYETVKTNPHIFII